MIPRRCAMQRLPRYKLWSQQTRSSNGMRASVRHKRLRRRRTSRDQLLVATIEQDTLMFHHFSLGTNELQRAKAFYDPIMAQLGYRMVKQSDRILP
jgi:hypothetical protein